MKKQIVLSIAILMMVGNACSQKASDPVLEKMSDLELGQYYLQKNKTQKTWGWILLGGGLGISTIALSNWELDSGGGTDALIVIGQVAAIASIPIFINAAKNKGRAEILLRNQNVPISKARLNYSSIGVGIPIGR